MASTQTNKAMANLLLRLLAMNMTGGRASLLSVRRRDACLGMDEPTERNTISRWGQISGGSRRRSNDLPAVGRLAEYLEDLFVRRITGARASDTRILSDHQTSAVLGEDLTVHAAAISSNAAVINAPVLNRALEPGRSVPLFHPAEYAGEPSGHEKLQSRAVLRTLSPILGREDDFWNEMGWACNSGEGQHVVVKHDPRAGLVLAIAGCGEDGSDVVPIRFLPKTCGSVPAMFSEPSLSGAALKAFEAGMAGNRLAARSTHLQQKALDHDDIWVFEKGTLDRLENSGLVHVLPDDPVFRVAFGSTFSRKNIERAVACLEDVRSRQEA